MSELHDKRAHLTTERVNHASVGLDSMSTAQAVRLFREQDAQVITALEGAASALEAAIDLVAAKLAAGGKLCYLGAGTSGRLGVLDAVECPPTFQSAPELVQGVLAGGPEAMFVSREGAEDDFEGGARDLDARELSASDVVLGITASGTTPYVLGGLARARELGAATVLLACVPEAEAQAEVDVSIRLETGPEVLQGSTRLKAGSATKMALNTISTLVMVRLGKVFENRMIDVNTRGNAKLLERGIRLVAELASIDRLRAAEWLEAAEGSVKLAVLMARGGLSGQAARAALKRCDGSLRQAIQRL